MLVVLALAGRYYLLSDAGASSAFTELTGTLLLLALLLSACAVYILLQSFRQQKLLEEQLKISRKKTEESVIIKDRFMANMSHEIRTPLNAIIGFSNRLQKTALNSEQKEFVNALQHSGDALMRIIDDVLDFSGIENGIIRIDPVEFGIRDSLNTLQTMFLGKAREKNNSLTLHIADQLPASVIGDSTRLNQVLINIIGNAVKFTRDGTIHVSADVVKDEKDIISVAFSVKDSGIGIPEQHLDKIFERFRQEKSDSSRTHGGMGLGLALSKRLIELQNGSIRVESNEGKGTEFIITLPYKKAKPLNPVVKEDEEDVPAHIRSKTRILIVEDNLLNQKLAGFLLKDWGFGYDIAPNGLIALEKMKASKFDLILMDIQMPEMNGYEATQSIRKEIDASIPILAMTAHALPGEKEKCLKYGMNDYIAKPVREAELLSLIKKHLRLNVLSQKEMES
ncbi:MAG: ATP-binding protein [Bacteroidia bacterium]